MLILILQGLLKKCTQVLLPMRASVSYGIFANKKPNLTTHSYRSTEVPIKKVTINNLFKSMI